MRIFKLNQTAIEFLKAAAALPSALPLEEWRFEVDQNSIILVTSSETTPQPGLFNSLRQRGFLEEVETSRVENILKNYEGV